MKQTISDMASNWLYAVPFSMLLVALWFQLQKTTAPKNKKYVSFDSKFIAKNVLFVGALVFAVMHLSKKQLNSDDFMYVGSADSFIHNT